VIGGKKMEKKEDIAKKMRDQQAREQQIGRDISWISLRTEKCMLRTTYSVNCAMKALKLPIRIMKKYAKNQPYWHWVEQIAPPGIKKEKRGIFRKAITKKGKYNYLGSNFDWKAVKRWNKRYVKTFWDTDPFDNNKKQLFIKIVPGKKNKIIFSKTAKKITKWNRRMRELYEIRREVRKLQRKWEKRTARYYDLTRSCKKLSDRLDKIEFIENQNKLQNLLTKTKKRV